MGSAEETAKLMLEVVPQLMRVIRSEMRSSAESDLTVPQFRILNKISKGHCTNRELSDWMGVTAPTISRMLATLRRRKLLRFKPDAKDKRIHQIELTSGGRERVSRIRSAVRIRLAAKLERLTPAETKDVQRVLILLREKF